jgi:hypothetical protein
MSRINMYLAALIASISCLSHAAQLEVNGDVTMNADLRNSPVSGVAIGPGAKADAEVNTMRGSVKVGGNVNMTVTARNSPVSALAIGPGAKASARVNAMVGE